MPSVLFVCTANMCRSPMASALFRNLVTRDHPDEKWRIESAGTWAVDGHPAMEKAQLVMQQRGLDLSSHQSRSVSREILTSFDLILTMESGHKEALRIEFPEIARRVYMLSEVAGIPYDVRDPVGRATADFEDVANEIEHLLERGFDRIQQLVSSATI